MDWKIAARMGAVLAIGGAMTAAVMARRGDGQEYGAEDAPAQSLHHRGGEPSHTPLGHSELVRCRDLGMTAASDDACRRVWAKNRQRFFDTRSPERPPWSKPGRFDAIAPTEPDTADTPSAAKITDRLPSATADGANADDGEALTR